MGCKKKSDDDDRCKRLRDKMKRSFKDTNDTPILIANCVVLHVTYIILTYWTFLLASNPDSNIGIYLVQLLLEGVFIVQALIFLAIFLLKKRKYVATYGTLIDHTSKHKLVAVAAFLMILSRLPYGFFFNDSSGGQSYGALMRYALGLAAVWIAQYYVHSQLARPLGWAIFSFIYNVLCFIVIGALIMESDSDPANKPDWNTWYRTYKENCDPVPPQDPDLLPPEEWESQFKERYCREIEDNVIILAVYFVTSGITGAGFGDITASNEVEIVKITGIILCFVIFKGIFLALIQAIVFAQTFYATSVKNKLTVVTNYLNRRMVLNEDCCEFQILNYFLDNARPEAQVAPFLPKELREKYLKACKLSYQNVKNMLHHPLLNILRRRRGWFTATYILKIVILVTLALILIFSDIVTLCQERLYYISKIYLAMILATSTGIGNVAPRLISGVEGCICIALVGWFFFNSVYVLLGSIKMSEDVLLVRYNEKMLFVMKQFRDLHDKKFRKNPDENKDDGLLVSRTWTGNRYDADYYEIIKGYQLRWLLYQELDLSPDSLGKFMDPRQLTLVNSDVANILRTIAHLRQLTFSQIELVLRQSQLKLFQRNEIVFKQLEMDSALYILLNGRVGSAFYYVSNFQRVDDDEKPPPILYHHMKAEVFGPFGFFENTLQSDTIKALEMTEMLKIETSKVSATLKKLQERMESQEKRLDIKYYEDTCRRPFLPRHNFDRSEPSRYMHLANAKGELEKHEVVTVERNVGDAVLVIIAILLRCALIILTLGLLTFFYRYNRRIFSGSLFAVRFFVILESILYRTEAADVLLTIANCENIESVRMKEKSEFLLNVVCIFNDLIVLIADVLCIYGCLLYLVTAFFNFVAIWLIFNTISYNKLGLLKTTSVIKIVVVVFLFEYCVACLLFTMACPTMLADWGIVTDTPIDQIPSYQTIEKEMSDLITIYGSQNLKEFLKLVGSPDPLATVEETGHICFIWSWWNVEAKHDVTYASFAESNLFQQVLQSYYFGVILTTNVGLGEMKPRGIRDELIVMCLALLGLLFFMIVGNIISSYLVNEDVELSSWRQQLYVRTKHLKWHGVKMETVNNLKRLYNYTWRMTRGKDISETMSEMNTFQQGEISYALYSQYLKNLGQVPKERDAKEEPVLRESYRTCNKMICSKIKVFFFNKDSIILKKNDLCKQVLIVQDGEVKTLKPADEEQPEETASQPAATKMQKVILYSKDIVHDYDPLYGLVANDIVANTDCKLLSIDFQEIENALHKTGVRITGYDDDDDDDEVEDEEEDSSYHKARQSTPTPDDQKRALRYLKRRGAVGDAYEDEKEEKKAQQGSNTGDEDDEDDEEDESSESNEDDDDDDDQDADDVAKKNWYLSVRRYLKNSLVVIIFIRVVLYTLFIVSPFIYIMEYEENYWALVGIVCGCCTILLLELVFVEPYISMTVKKQVFKYFLQICSVVPVECMHHFLDSDSEVLRYVELVYALLFRVAFLIYRFHEISDALNSFLGIGNIIVGVITEFINGFLFFHSMTFFFIGATCLFRLNCDKDTLIASAVQKMLQNPDATFRNKNALIYVTSFYFVITVTTSAGFGDLVPRMLLETQLALLMAIFGRIHAAYMMGVIASLYAFGVNKKTKYYDELERLKIELDLILRSGSDKSVGLTQYERKNIEKYADLGWNLTEGIHMSSLEVYKNTPYAMNAAEKVELYKSFLLKVLKEPEYEEMIDSLKQNDFTPFRSNNEVRRALLRVICLLVEEQVLLAGTTLRQQQPVKWYTMVKKGEIINAKNEQPEEHLLFDKKYKVTSTCLLLLMPRQACETLIKDYVDRATGVMLASDSEEENEDEYSGKEVIIEDADDKHPKSSELEGESGETTKNQTSIDMSDGDKPKKRRRRRRKTEVIIEDAGDDDYAKSPEIIEEPRKRRRRKRSKVENLNDVDKTDED